MFLDGLGEHGKQFLARQRQGLLLRVGKLLANRASYGGERRPGFGQLLANRAGQGFERGQPLLQLGHGLRLWRQMLPHRLGEHGAELLAHLRHRLLLGCGKLLSHHAGHRRQRLGQPIFKAGDRLLLRRELLLELIIADPGRRCAGCRGRGQRPHRHLEFNRWTACGGARLGLGCARIEALPVFRSGRETPDVAGVVHLNSRHPTGRLPPIGWQSTIRAVASRLSRAAGSPAFLAGGGETRSRTGMPISSGWGNFAAQPCAFTIRVSHGSEKGMAGSRLVIRREMRARTRVLRRVMVWDVGLPSVIARRGSAGRAVSVEAAALNG